MISEETSTNNNSANAGQKGPTTTASPVEIQQFTSYLLRVVPLATDLNSTNETEEFKRALNEKSSAVDGIRRFLSDPQCVVFFIRVIQQGKGMYLSSPSIHILRGMKSRRRIRYYRWK